MYEVEESIWLSDGHFDKQRWDCESGYYYEDKKLRFVGPYTTVEEAKMARASEMAEGEEG